MTNTKVLIILDIKQATPRWTNYISELIKNNCKVDLLIHHSGKYIVETEIETAQNLKIFYSFYISLYGRNRYLTKLLWYTSKYTTNNRTFLSIYEILAFRMLLLKAKSLCRKWNYNIVLTSNSPFYTHIVGSHLRNNFDIKWIADYRDLWSLNHGRTYTEDKQVVFERKILAGVDACITVSEGFRKDLRKVYNGPIHVIYNGYKRLNQASSLSFDDILNIEYTGQIYGNNQEIVQTLDFFMGSRHVSSKNLRINFSGSSGIFIKNYFKMKKIPIPEFFAILGHVSHTEVLKRQASASFLLFLNWVKDEDRGVVLGKIYEYIASGVPILIVGKTLQKEVKTIIENSGFFVDVNSQNDLDDFLGSYLAHDLKLPERNVDFIAQFQYSKQVQTLLLVLEDFKIEKISADLKTIKFE